MSACTRDEEEKEEEMEEEMEEEEEQKEDGEDDEGLERSANASSGYKGVTKNVGVTKGSNCWEAYVHDNGQKIHLGNFGTAVEAARARKARLLLLAKKNKESKGRRPKGDKGSTRPVAQVKAPAGLTAFRGKPKDTPPGEFYQDESGDLVHVATTWQTPCGIATIYQVRVEELLMANRAWYLEKLKAHDKLKSGTQVVVPQSAKITQDDVPWQSTGHSWIGKGVHRQFDEVTAIGRVVAYAPPGEAEDEPALWRVVHDDGDEEHLDEQEMLTALKKGNKKSKKQLSQTENDSNPNDGGGADEEV